MKIKFLKARTAVILAAKTLRCSVQLDFPPAGFRTPQNQPESRS